jgi:hypothetical protein
MNLARHAKLDRSVSQIISDLRSSDRKVDFTLVPNLNHRITIGSIKGSACDGSRIQVDFRMTSAAPLSDGITRLDGKHLIMSGLKRRAFSQGEPVMNSPIEHLDQVLLKFGCFINFTYLPDKDAPLEGHDICLTSDQLRHRAYIVLPTINIQLNGQI